MGGMPFSREGLDLAGLFQGLLQEWCQDVFVGPIWVDIPCPSCSLTAPPP